MKQFMVPATLAGLCAVAVGGAIFLGADSIGGSEETAPAQQEQVTTGFGSGQTVTLYKSPTCGCCAVYADALREEGFAVDVRNTRDMRSVKTEHQIPLEGESCHTSLIGDYVVEGHVPLEAIEKLLSEQPEVAGIGLPSMPLGTPGMPGPKAAPYEIYQLSADGVMSPYLTL
mgnify:CR=1 FL=1